MGYGGALIWSGVARNVRAASHRPVVLLYRRSWLDRLQRHAPKEHEVFRENNDIIGIIDRLYWPWIKWQRRFRSVSIIDISNPLYQYWEADTPRRLITKAGCHAIQIACDALGIHSVDLSPKIVLAASEHAHARALLRRYHLKPKEFICINPTAKETFSSNKGWIWERWQQLVIRFPHLRWAQIGPPGSRLLKGIINLTGQLTFREHALVLEDATLFVGTEGGFVHLAKAVSTPAVVITSPMLPAELMAYSEHIRVAARTTHSACGSKKYCFECHAAIDAITVDQVAAALERALPRN